jgi:phosphoribosyl 1,2-cyclic phosphate phosphodiesterase
MKIQYLGTAAAEAFPSIFCHCDTCCRARHAGGKNIRGRSGIVINDTLMVDFPPDIYFQSLKFNIDLGNVENMVITHTHLDHFAVNELMMRDLDCYAHLPDGKEAINLYGNLNVSLELFEMMDKEFGNIQRNFVNYTEVKPFASFFAGDVKVTPLPAKHATRECCLIYIFEYQGKSFLYAHDSGFFLNETWDYISNIYFDLVSLDCCFGNIEGGGGHMGISDNVRVKDKLIAMKSANKSTKFIINHFSHNCGSLHSELEAVANPLDLIVAYDGMLLNL